MGQRDQNNRLSSRLRRAVNKTCALHNEELSSYFSQCNFHTMATPKLQKPSCLDPDSAISKGVNQKKHNDTTVPGNTYTTYACQINTKNTPSSTMMRSGVYFNNREIFDTIHPAQVNHREGQVIKVLNLPVGMLLAKPPCISAIKHEALPPISTNITDRTLRRKHDAMQSEEEPRLRKKTRREERRSMDEKPKEKRSQRTRAGNSACNPSSGNTLSSEERLFFEAAKKLSSSDVPALKIEEVNHVRHNPLKLAGQVISSRSPRSSHSNESSLRTLLPLRQKS